jgi:hypothetical protein
MKENGKGLLWFEKEFGVDPKSLDKPTRQLVQKLGPEGVNDLVRRHLQGQDYRGMPRSKEEIKSTMERIQRIQQTGISRWLNGKRIGDKPEIWLLDELKDLGEKIDFGE